MSLSVNIYNAKQSLLVCNTSPLRSLSHEFIQLTEVLKHRQYHLVVLKHVQTYYKNQHCQRLRRSYRNLANAVGHEMPLSLSVVIDGKTGEYNYFDNMCHFSLMSGLQAKRWYNIVRHEIALPQLNWYFIGLRSGEAAFLRRMSLPLSRRFQARIINQFSLVENY